MAQPNLTTRELEIIDQVLSEHNDNTWDDINSMGVDDPLCAGRVAYTEEVNNLLIKVVHGFVD